MFAVGTEAKEDISQKNFRRWNGFGTMAVSVEKDASKAVLLLRQQQVTASSMQA